MTVPTAAGLDRLSIHRCRLDLTARERIAVPPTRLPNVLRGAFDVSFRLDCRVCPVFGECPYPPLFRPSPPPDTDRLSRAQDIPRPFLFEPPVDGPEEIAAGSTMSVGLTVVGAAQRFFPYLVVAVRAVADRGLGPTRGRLRLDRVTALTAAGEETVFVDGAPTIAAAVDGTRLPDLLRPGDAAARRVRVSFLTPTTLKRNGQLVRDPSFADLACRLRDRVSSLAAFFGDGPVEMDFAGVAGAAAGVRTVSCTTAWDRRSRRSSRTGQVHETSGFVGEAVYEGDVGGWMPLLRLGEVVHVGKYAVWGNGRLGVEVQGR
jgi:hypothetical protein